MRRMLTNRDCTRGIDQSSFSCLRHGLSRGANIERPHVGVLQINRGTGSPSVDNCKKSEDFNNPSDCERRLKAHPNAAHHLVEDEQCSRVSAMHM